MSREDDIALIKGSMDWLSLTAVGGWFIGLLPAIATALSVIWMLIRIAETKTIKGLFNGQSEGGDDPPPPNPFESTD